MTKKKLDPQKFSLAGAIAVGVLWAIYSAVMFLMLFLARDLSGDYGYTGFTNFHWQVPLVKFILFLYMLCLGTILTGRMTAKIYNFLIDKFETKLP